MSVITGFYFDILIAKLSQAAAWRRSLVAQYPADKRNLHAALELERLAAATAVDVSPDTWATLVPSLETESFVEAVNQANRAVGFRNRPASFDAYLQSVATFASIGGAQ